MYDLFVSIVALFIFKVYPVIFLRITSIASLLGEGVSLRFTISWNDRFGVLGQKMQSIIPSLWVYVIHNSVVVVYFTLQFDMPPTNIF